VREYVKGEDEMGVTPKGELAYPSNGTTVQLGYPSGWFGIGFSQELPPGGMMTRRLAGDDVVLYRTQKGLLQAVRPYCPHMGGHLGRGGKVEGECIICPFHGFAYSPDGSCAQAYGQSSRPPQIRLTKLVTREVNDLILLWHDGASPQPTWEVPHLDLTGFSRHSDGHLSIKTHVQQICENTIDTGHFASVHRVDDVTYARATKFDGPFCTIVLSGSQMLPVVGRQELLMSLDLYGLGFVTMGLEIPRLRIKGMVLALFAPTAPWETELRVRTSANLNCTVPSFLGKLAASILSRTLLHFALRDTKDDMKIWDNLRYLNQPKLVRADGQIMELRRWSRQFYPEAQPSGDPMAKTPERRQTNTTADSLSGRRAT
jgi:nitrite reductase/ring-hydroxylating ferredoxin subunit